VIANDELGYGWQTYPERLQAAGISWKIYQDIGEGLDQAGVWGFTADPYIGNYGDNSLLYFFNYQNAARRFWSTSPTRTAPTGRSCCTAQARSRLTPATPAAGMTSRWGRLATPASAISSPVAWSPATG
jgi:phospholipase C